LNFKTKSVVNCTDADFMSTG